MLKMEEVEKTKYGFYAEDEYGNRTELNKESPASISDEFPMIQGMAQDFLRFLELGGYPKEMIVEEIESAIETLQFK